MPSRYAIPLCSKFPHPELPGCLHLLNYWYGSQFQHHPPLKVGILEIQLLTLTPAPTFIPPPFRLRLLPLDQSPSPLWIPSVNVALLLPLPAFSLVPFFTASR
jgi:hypothetical protein